MPLPEVTLKYHEMTLLERSIVEYERKANAYYTKKNIRPVDETPEEKGKREKEWADALTHLKNERHRIRTLARVESQLEVYRQQGRRAAEQDPLALLDEPHHPTKALAENMRADGRAKPSERHSPHHIVQGKGRQAATADVRLQLHLYGIRINDPDNGVWLPRHKTDKGHWSMPNAPAHSEIHTYNYETWVHNLITLVDSEETIRAQLIRIRTLLRDGRQPMMVTAKKDTAWRGQ